MSSIPSVQDLIFDLEQHAPDVYTKCYVNIVNKKGEAKAKKCVINLKTGDIFKNRAIPFYEKCNYQIIRKYSDRNLVDTAVMLKSFRNAQVVDGNIVLTTWVFGDYYNYPGTTQVPSEWDVSNPIDLRRKVEPVDSNALVSVKLSTARIASMVVVTPEKGIYTWDNIDEYGLLEPRYGNDENRYLSPDLYAALMNATYSKTVVGLTEAFKKVFNIGYVGANKYIIFDSYKDIPVFMKANPLVKRESSQQKRIDDLVQKPLTSRLVSGFESVICYVDRVDDEWAVVRWYRKLNVGEYLETTRMYVNKTDAIHCRYDLQHDWIYAGSKIKSETFNADKIVLASDDVCDNTKLEYFQNISTTMSNPSAALYMLTMYPEFEKLCKVGLDWLCEIYLSAKYQSSWKNFLQEKVGSVDWNAKNVFKMLGINKHQADVFSEFHKKLKNKYPAGTWQYRYLTNIISKVKNAFGVVTLSSIDNATFDYILESMYDVDRLLGSYIPALTITFEMYHNDAMYFIRDLNEAARNNHIVTINRNRHGHCSQMTIDSLYLDVMRMIQSGNYMDTLRPRFSSVDELIAHHDIMIDLVNANQENHNARVSAQISTGFKTNHTRWQKFEWDDDDTYCVIAPKAPVDIAIEGITLRHCVKSYIQSVALGNTNIVFIRRKEQTEDPFFTVEVDNFNNIRQIHGMCNSNVDTVSGLADFVKRWCKQKKLKYNAQHANVARAVRY